MITMNVSLPEPLKRFVDEQVRDCGYASSSEYVGELIRREQQRQRLQAVACWRRLPFDDSCGRRLFRVVARASAEDAVGLGSA